MPSTPELWRDLGQVNTVDPGIGADLQIDPKVIHLSNGNILFAWTSNADVGAGAAAGLDIIGKVYDSLGNLVQDEFRINENFFLSDESDVDFAAKSDGGFVAVYIDDNGSDDTDVRLINWDSTFTSAVGTIIAPDTSDADTYRNPSIEIASGISAVITYERVNPDGNGVSGDVDVELVTYNPTTNTVGATSLIIDGIEGAGEGVSGNNVATLSNGNYVVVVGNNNGSTNDRVFVQIHDSTGAQISGSITVSDIDLYTQDPHVAALTGGGFVVVYEVSSADPPTNSGLRAKVYDNSGGLVAGSLVPATTTPGNQTNGVIAALADGGFVIAWVDEGSIGIHGQRYDALGVKVGSEIDIASGIGSASIAGLDIEGLDDGRFVVTWEQVTIGPSPTFLPDFDIHAKVFDPRDQENSPNVYTDNEVIGTIGNDAINVVAPDENIFGWDGDDIFAFTDSLVADIDDLYDAGDDNDEILLQGTGTVDLTNAELRGFEGITSNQSQRRYSHADPARRSGRAQ